MRFEISRVLDAIERRLSTDPVLAGAIVDVGEVLRAVELDGGRPTYLPRLGAVIDALAGKLEDEAVPVYAIADRGLMSSLELTSNEKMVLRRWADDGLIEVLGEVDPGRRLIELAGITGLPVLSRNPLPVPVLLAPVPGVQGVALIERQSNDRALPPSGLLARRWHCPEGEGVSVPSLLGTGHPACPRHGHPLADDGPRLPAVPVTVWIQGAARCRFAVGAELPVLVGRAPNPGVMLGPWLDDESLQWISRAHVELVVTGQTLQVTDLSTNGTTVVRADGARVDLERGQRQPLADDDTVELYRGVELRRVGQHPGRLGPRAGGIMAEAPTIALRLPGQS